MPTHSELVSIVMANHNGAAFLRDALRSALAQTHDRIEVLLADDASSDASLAIAREIADEDPRLRILTTETRGGPAAARNRALAAASGDWIAIVDADDLMHPRRLERLLALSADRMLDGIADDLIFFGAEIGKTLLDPLNLTGPADLTADEMVRQDSGGQAAVALGYLKPLLRRAALKEMRYREDLPIGEDFDLLLRVLLSGARIAMIPQGYYLYRRHATSTSHRITSAHALAMITAQDELANDPAVSPDLARAFADRRIALATTARFEGLVADIKGRHFVRACRGIARDPAFAARLATIAKSRWARTTPNVHGPTQRVVIGTAGMIADAPPPAIKIAVPEPSDDAPAIHWARFVSAVARPGLRLRAVGDAGREALGYVPGWCEVEFEPPAAPVREIKAPLPWPVFDGTDPKAATRVHIRTTTYRRPDALTRCLESLRAQTHDNWVCDVFDDDPQGSAGKVIDALGDARIRHHQNRPQLFASANIDQCFSRNNPRSATYFCVVEDDNFLMPRFLEDNIRLCRETGVPVVFRNQLVEWRSGMADAALSHEGILDDKLRNQVYAPDHFRLSLLVGIGVSNGGLFWSRDALSDLEIHQPCSAALQEYLRTFAIADPIHVAMEPLAVWAENGADTKRDLGQTASWLRRELSLKNSVARLQRQAWAMAPQAARDAFLDDNAFNYNGEDRARGLVKSHVSLSVRGQLPLREVVRLALRGAAIRTLGKPEPGLSPFLAAQSDGR